MKITILTVCYNNQETILATLNSVLNQTYKNIEHIIVDGKSTDKTKIFLKKYPYKNKKIFYTKKKGVYAALNYGIKKATGDILHILHADDIYNSPDVISNIIKIAKKRKKEKIFTTDIVYFHNNNYTSVSRYFGAKKFTNKKIYFGIMPPHTGLFFKKNIYKKFFYDETYKIAGDFELLLRIILKKTNLFYTNLISVRMRTGGLSTKNMHSYITTTFEIIKAFKKYKLNLNILRPLLRVPEKISQLFFFKKNNVNKDFQLKYSEFFKKNSTYDFFIKKKLNYSDFSKNFIYSAMNLAFLGNFANNSIKKNKHLIHWPDGIFSKNICDINIKIPGREILRSLEIPKNITNITVIGNLSNNGKLYLENLYKKSVKNVNLPYGNIQKIIKNFKYKTSKSELILTTLPTPKQEILADYISKSNKYFKVICIGGSIGIACGDETEVPNIFYNFEFLWRLKYETKRRFLRLICTLFYYFHGRYIGKSLSNLKIAYEV